MRSEITESSAECLHTDLTLWEVGPYHGMLPGPMRLRLRLDGEIVVHGEFETGFLHRGLEKCFEQQPWRTVVPYADHLDPEAAVFGELALCLAVEEIGAITVPPRAQTIRILLSELSRISAHLIYMVRVARAVGSETMVHYVLRDREKILDLFELLAGARFSLNFLRFGGVRADVTEGFIERVLEVGDLIRLRLKEYNDLFTFNRAFLKRAAHVGVISQEAARRQGVTGPNARAAGIAWDIRKTHPYTAYELFDFEIPQGRGQFGTRGDAHDRFLLRLREISQSLEILKQAADFIPKGVFHSEKFDPSAVLPPGEAYVRIESSRGLLGCHVVSDGGDKPCRVQFRTPSLSNISLIPELVEGVRIEDLPLILASLDISIPEVDR